jgi:hypothetical protein
VKGKQSTKSNALISGSRFPATSGTDKPNKVPSAVTHLQPNGGRIDLALFHLQAGQVWGLSFQKTVIGFAQQFLFPPVGVQVRLNAIKDGRFEFGDPVDFDQKAILGVQPSRAKN